MYDFIEFVMDFCMYDDILDAIWITDKTLLHFKLSKSGQILCVDKTCFPRPGHNYGSIYILQELEVLLFQVLVPEIIKVSS